MEQYSNIVGSPRDFDLKFLRCTGPSAAAEQSQPNVTLEFVCQLQTLVGSCPLESKNCGVEITLHWISDAWRVSDIAID
jgi:hypothetical protein